MPDSPATAVPDDTRTRLIAVALRQFGNQGFAAASIRSIAAGAETNVASIAYHFGSKAGLYRACAERVADLVDATLGPTGETGSLPPGAAAARLEAMIRAMVGFLVTAPMAEAMVGFILRELAEGGEALDLIYDRLFEPRHRELCTLWAAATGQPAESEAVRLAVFAMIGQVVYFRIARSLVLRRMGWRSVGPDEAGRIADTLAANLHAALEGHRR